MKTTQSDQRFIHITDCEISGLYRKIPQQFGGWKICIRYKDNADDIFPKIFQIDIDQRKFGEEFLNADFDKKDTRLCYTDGMTDIDIFKKGKKYVIYHSVHDGQYIYFFFSAKEFNNLKTWLELENKDE